MKPRKNIQCPVHGKQRWGAVCSHLTPKGPSLGFHQGSKRADRLPDAMCTDCRFGTIKHEATDIKVVCEKCYLALSKRHSRAEA
jgi:hypothetical protein